MANINVNDLINLNLAGADLFNDPESFMKDLNEESEQVIGGMDKIPVYCLQPTCVQTHRHCLDRTGIGVVHMIEPAPQLV
jgi:hypothetical protein